MAQTPTLDTLANFDGVTPGLTKGNGPRGALVFGADGQLYGTADQGGSGTGAGNGVVYKIDTNGVFTSLVDFAGTSDGGRPKARLLLASDGNFYGTTSAGGADGLGTVFQVTPGGALSIIYTFRTLTQKDTGATPTDGLIEGGDGYLYGTATTGGFNGYGTVFKILPGSANAPVRLVDFTGSTGTKRGTNPSALIRAKDGNFYGTTEGGGSYGNGSVFKLTTAGSFTTIADFGKASGTYTGPQSPRAALVQGKNGIFYGTSAAGGSSGNGTIYSVTTAGAYKVLVNLSGGTGSFLGRTPEASLIQATDGYLYGTTRLGGTSNRGTIFRVTAAGSFKTLINFTGGAPTFGAEPRGALVQDNEGHFFGTTSTGGSNALGTVFRVNNALPPKATVVTNAVTFISGTRATLSGSVNPQGTTALYWFEYGLTNAYGSRAPLTSLSAGAGKAAVTVKTTITGLAPSTTYHYRIVSSNGGGTSQGGDQSFFTGPNPNVLTPPADQLVGIGQQAQFDVSAIGLALKYAWLKSTSTTVLGTAASYKITKAALVHAGSFSVKVSDGADTVQTPAARLGVISLANSTVTVNEGSETTLLLPNAGPGLTFQWKTGAGNVVNDGRITGAQTAGLRITNANGGDTNTYFCTVSLGALTLNSGSFTVTTRLKPVVNMPSLGPWTTNGKAFGSITAQNSPTRFDAVNLPPGVVLNTTTGVLSGQPKIASTYVVQFTATNLAGASATLNYPITIVAASTNAAGSYHGITNRDATGNTSLGGRFTLTLSTLGSGSGSVVHLGKSFGFAAALDNIPGATRSIIITPSIVAGFPPVVATLTEATGDITGTINGIAFTAKRNAFTASPVGVRAGVYNLAFSPTSADAGNPALPQGSGYGSLTVANNGVVTWTGKVTVSGVTSADDKIGDGASISGASLLASDGTIPWHFPLYAVGTGSAQGWLSIDTSSVLTEQSFDWIKLNSPANASSRSYKTGFALHNLEADGGKYVKPATNVNVLGLTGTTDNAKLVFTDGGLTATITQVLSLPATNVPKITLPSSNSVKLTFDLITGHFFGTFVLPDPLPANVRTVKYAGVLIPRLQQGIGHFQLPQLPSPTTSAILSGRVVLNANP